MMNKKIITTLIATSAMLTSAWVIAMVIIPAIATNLNWLEIQEIWDRWQTLNSGMIALLAAMLAIYAAQHTENARRQRELIAARALLPLALSDLHKYCIELAIFIRTEYLEWSKNRPDEVLTTNNEVPDRPAAWVFEAFKNCMIHTNENEAKFMASILSEAQIINSRLHDYKNNNHLIMESTFSGYRSYLCDIHAKLGRMFQYSREHTPLLTENITDEERHNSTLVLDIELIP
ncbi:hypothetical protein K3H47_09605 [Aeromonas veronii]|uniref:hypothetical protein n=1 Tax=Aeromonas veronii TaxID=654 RepID=UPI001F45BB1E|nr:hypothetical protein [Aeromonas veronii]MCF5764197.1 hypothetical protein [Aeromonas veronii]